MSENSPGTAEIDAPVPVDLRADGVLWAVNRILFHPRGFALAVVPETGALSLLGDGSETWRYGEPVNEDQHFADFEALLERARTRVTPPEVGPGA